jgi:hypothetical protein
MERKKLKNKQIESSTFPCSRRTTIYLPTNIKINHPTQAIHNIVNQINEKEMIILFRNIPTRTNNIETIGYQVEVMDN